MQSSNRRQDNKKQAGSGNNARDRLERKRCKLVAKSSAAVTFMCKAESLLGHEVSQHGGRGGESCSDVALFHVLPAKMNAHINVASSRLVGRMERHGDSAFVVTEEDCRARLTKTKVTEEETQIERLFGPFREGVVFGLLCAQADC